MSYIDKIQVDGVDYDLEAPQIYDDQERVIGTWFGKPLYRKVISLTVQEYNNLEASGNLKLLPLNIYIKNIIRADMVALNFSTDGTATNNRTYPMHYVNTSSGSDLGVHNYKNSVADASVSNLEIFINNAILTRASGNIYITLEYTKTTD